MSYLFETLFFLIAFVIYIYRVHVYDYQAICLELDPTYGFAPFLLTVSIVFLKSNFYLKR